LRGPLDSYAAKLNPKWGGGTAFSRETKLHYQKSATPFSTRDFLVNRLGRLFEPLCYIHTDLIFCQDGKKIVLKQDDNITSLARISLCVMS
jgi:hypothetical protein